MCTMLCILRQDTEDIKICVKYTFLFRISHRKCYYFCLKNQYMDYYFLNPQLPARIKQATSTSKLVNDYMMKLW